MSTKGLCIVVFGRCVDASRLVPLSRRGLWFCSRGCGISAYQVIIDCLSLWCSCRFLPLYLVRRSSPALETVGVLHNGQEFPCGLHIFLCLVCRERRRVPAITCQSVAVGCGSCVWFCVFAGRFLFSFGGPHKYRIQCVISLSFSECRTGLLWYVVRVSTLLCLRFFCVW